MKRSVIILIPLLFIFFSSSGQKALEIRYRCSLNGINKSALLKASKTESIFSYATGQKSIMSSTLPESATPYTQEIDVEVVLSDSIGKAIYVNFPENTIVSREILMLENQRMAFIVFEDREPIKWKLKKEKKQIGKYNCRKASTEFRGRNYVVWFSEEIPTTSGPWKFNGLPGAILEAYDETFTFHFIAESIKQKHSMIINQPHQGTKVSLEEFIEKRNSIVDNFQNYIQSKLPRGAEFVITGVNKNWMEKEFNFCP